MYYSRSLSFENAARYVTSIHRGTGPIHWPLCIIYGPSKSNTSRSFDVSIFGLRDYYSIMSKV